MTISHVTILSNWFLATISPKSLAQMTFTLTAYPLFSPEIKFPFLSTKKLKYCESLPPHFSPLWVPSSRTKILGDQPEAFIIVIWFSSPPAQEEQLLIAQRFSGENKRVVPSKKTSRTERCGLPDPLLGVRHRTPWTKVTTPGNHLLLWWFYKFVTVLSLGEALMLFFSILPALVWAPLTLCPGTPTTTVSSMNRICENVSLNLPSCQPSYVSDQHWPTLWKMTQPVLA